MVPCSYTVILLTFHNYRTPIGWMGGSTGANPGAGKLYHMPFCF